MNGIRKHSRPRLALSSFRPILERCGYPSSMLRVDVSCGAAKFENLVAFAHQPLDARSSCIAVAEARLDSADRLAELKALAAPIVFLLRDDAIEWWQQGVPPRRIGSAIPHSKVSDFFSQHLRDFAPDVVYRAKTWGRFDKEFQLSFVDVGLMPLVESEIGGKLEQLITTNVQSLKSLLRLQTVTAREGAWLLKSVFWLISAKILCDKAVAGFERINLADVEQVVDAVGTHFGAERIVIDSKERRDALSEIARKISKFSSLELTTTESLARVYESTLISKETRQQLGTHSTPAYLVDYVVGQLRPWIQEINLNDRNVFEPACGHAAFLVSAMRLLTELHPEGSVAQKRRSYLRKRLHGCEIDAFALEIARLSLSLTDIPNPNGWDLRLGDMFVNSSLEAMAKEATILLANPPFENFGNSDKSAYERKRIELKSANKATEMLQRTLPIVPQGAAVGLVVPRGFLNSKGAKGIRKLLTTDFELKEVCLFPDKVFTFADAESAVILARKSSRASASVRFRRIRERDMDRFRANSDDISEVTVAQSRFAEHDESVIDVPELEPLWKCFTTLQRLSDVADVGQGLTYKGGLPRKGVVSSSTKQFAEAARGFRRFEKRLLTHELPTEFWLSLSKDVIRDSRYGTTTGVAQVILNEAPNSRGPWRIKALMDPEGHAVTGRFIVIRPFETESKWLDVIWAIVNSPVGNAFAFSHSNKRHNNAGMIRDLPIPSNDLSLYCQVYLAVSEYRECVSRDHDEILRKPINAEKAKALLLRVDCEVLKLYGLPRTLERQLLDYFAGWAREGVPFRLDRYFPDHFTDRISLADYLAITDDWPQTNRRRTQLIDKHIANSISAQEQVELEHLQSLASSRRNLIAPLPVAELERWHRDVTGAIE